MSKYLSQIHWFLRLPFGRFLDTMSSFHHFLRTIIKLLRLVLLSTANAMASKPLHWLLRAKPVLAVKKFTFQTGVNTMIIMCVALSEYVQLFCRYSKRITSFKVSSREYASVVSGFHLSYNTSLRHLTFYNRHHGRVHVLKLLKRKTVTIAVQTARYKSCKMWDTSENIARCPFVYVKTSITGRTSMARTSFGPWKFVLDMLVNHNARWGEVCVCVCGGGGGGGAVANGYKRNVLSTFCKIMVCRVYNLLHEVILMFTHNIHFHDREEHSPEVSLYICFLSYLKNCLGIQKTNSYQPR